MELRQRVRFANVICCRAHRFLRSVLSLLTMYEKMRWQQVARKSLTSRLTSSRCSGKSDRRWDSGTGALRCTRQRATHSKQSLNSQLLSAIQSAANELPALLQRGHSRCDFHVQCADFPLMMRGKGSLLAANRAADLLARGLAGVEDRNRIVNFSVSSGNNVRA